MRRILFALSVVGSFVVGVTPAMAQDELQPPSPEDAAAIDAIEALDDGFICPAVPEATNRDYTEIRASSGLNGIEVASDRIDVRCDYSAPGGLVSVKVSFGRTGVRPTICDVEALPYEAVYGSRRGVDLGQLRPPLAITAEFEVHRDASAATVDGFRATATVLTDMVAPMAETCPTPLDIEISSLDETAAAQVAILDDATADACSQLEIPAGVELTRSAALQFATVSTTSLTVLDGEPIRVPATNPRIECRYTNTSYQITVDTEPALSPRGFVSGMPFANRDNGCDGTDQYAPPAALKLTVEGDDDARPFAEAQARQIADALLPLAVDCDLEAAAYGAVIAAEAPPTESINMVCPTVDGFLASAYNQSTGSPGPAAANLNQGVPRIFPGIDGGCSYDTEDGSTAAVRLTLFILQDWRPAEEAERLCSATDRVTTETTFGRIVAGDSAAMVDIVVVAPRSGDIQAAEAGARAWLQQGAALARTCDDVEITDVDSLFEPVPSYLTEAVEAGLAGSFAVAPPPDGEGDTQVVTLPLAPGGESGGMVATLLRVARVAMLVVSLAGLALSLVLARRPSRIRPAMESLRIAFALGGAAVMMTLFSVGAPLWAVGLALFGGAALGLTQGRNLTVLVTQKGLMAKRSAMAIAAFAVGLVATQVAGLLNRSGIISIGLALSFLSGATAAGLVAGRRPALVSARAAATGAALLIIAGATLAPLAVRPSSAQEETVPTAVDILNRAVAWDEISINGGIASTVKPDVTITLDPSFATAPEPITRDLSVDAYNAGSFEQVAGTETFSFELVDGICCEILYSAQGTLARQYLDGWKEPAQPLVVEQGSLGVIGPVYSFSGVRFDSASRRSDGSCGREIADQRTDVEPQAEPAVVLGGEETRGLLGPVEIWAPCELDISLADAAGVTEPPPSADASERTDGGRQCPVNQEVIDTLAAATTFDPVTASSLTRRFVNPNLAVCWDSGIEFGEEGPGGVRSELTYYLSRPDPAAAVEFDRDSYGYINGGPRNSELELVCEPGADGVPLPSPEGDCARVGFHQVVAPSGAGQFYILNDFDSSDGPNVIVRGVFPNGIFRYRCHHCLPGDPEVASMIQSITALVNQGAPGGSLGTVIGSRGGPAALPVGGASSSSSTDTGSSANEEAAIAGLIGLIAAMGITAATLAESGLTAADLLTSWRDGGASAVRSTLAGASAATVLDEHGNALNPNADDLYEWETPGGVELLDRASIEERIAAEREAIGSSDARHDSIVAEQLSDEEAEQRFDDLVERSIAGNDAEMEEIRAGWGGVDELGAQLEARERALGALEAAEADQDLATLRDTWGQIFSETAQASWSDATEIPGILVDATRTVVQAAADPENWRVVAEGAAETIYDTAGLLTGGQFGDAQESIQQGAVTAGRVGVALGGQFIRHPIDTAAMFIPGRDLYDALDGDRPLGQRLGSVGIGVLDIGATLLGAGVLSHADELVDASRAMDLAGEAAEASRVVEATTDTARTVHVAEASADISTAARAAEAAGTVPERMVETARLADAAQEARDAARTAIASGNSADAARAMDAAAEAERAADAARRSLFGGEGMQAMGRAEAAGGVSDELAQSIVNMHDDLTGAASRQGVVDAVDDFAGEFGFHPREVMMGNSGSVGAGRSVLTDADRTIVASFTRDQLDGARRAGESYADTQRRLQARLSELHQRSAELRLNPATDPAVVLARREGISLTEAAARLGDADDPAAAAARLTGKDMDMASYAGFGSGAGQADAYPMGYTRARQATQGSTEVFTFGDRAGDARSYSTSGQAIIDRNELGQVDLRAWDSELQQLQRRQGLDSPLANAADIDTAWGADRALAGLDTAADPTRIGNAEMRSLFEQQQSAMSHYKDAKSVSKAVDRASYVAGRIGQPLPNQRLVDAARTVRANPRATQAVLAELGMTEPELVANLQQMMTSYQPVFPT